MNVMGHPRVPNLLIAYMNDCILVFAVLHINSYIIID